MTPPLASVDYFAKNYADSRARFIAACERAGGRHQQLFLDTTTPDGQSLSIDIAHLGAAEPRRAVIVSSGVHGVETPLGSAVQLATLQRWRDSPPTTDDFGVVLVHAVNPFGYAMRRRFNENNVDLNRNFLVDGESYEGAPPLAAAFRNTLGAPSRPLRIATSTLRMGLLAARHGQRAFWETLPVGQYEHPDWIFYGGKALQQSGQLLGDYLPTHLAGTEEIIQLDFHTGLGRWANCELLLGEMEASGDVEWWRSHFDESRVVEADNVGRYMVRGSFGRWMQQLLRPARLHYACAEFGTYKALQVVRCLADENRWTQSVGNLSPFHWSRLRLAEAFAPKNPRWRRKSLATGIQLVEHAERLLAESTS